MSATDSDPGAPLPSLCVVVVNWNGRGVLADCLGSLERSDYPGLRVVLVDNASSDPSVSYVRSAFPAVEVLVAPENLRWAGGNNLALARLGAEGWPQDQVLLLNNDTVVPAGSLQRLCAALRDEPRAWAATPRIVYADEPSRAWYDGGLVGSWSGWVRHAGIRRVTDRLPVADRFVEYGTGCALLLDRRGLARCGLLDTGYHFYGEDVDYCLRLRAAGGAILHVPRSVILHKVSVTLGAASPLKIYLRSRSHVRLLRRHWPRRRWPILLPAQVCYAGGHLLWHLRHGRPRAALALVAGVLDEWRGRPLRGATVDSGARRMVT
ncbi:MAG TPA: glycosyltransferase family 2 protein [Candidatus Krumholzibacteria bacterium]|nr:glycosyltransferase family 2 protein [Candidatus Krumholzibacteria bacterium]HPD72767.1 glycosyltransferase family 2 protein [Candidatus Krumholzibacteria bacterium]HRY40301.1 glycosyltransferase family 2 protein [Candidatus Krumholzibacteria bacterium]